MESIHQTEYPLINLLGISLNLYNFYYLTFLIRYLICSYYCSCYSYFNLCLLHFINNFISMNFHTFLIPIIDHTFLDFHTIDTIVIASIITSCRDSIDDIAQYFHLLIAYFHKLQHFLVFQSLILKFWQCHNHGYQNRCFCRKYRKIFFNFFNFRFFPPK